MKVFLFICHGLLLTFHRCKDRDMIVLLPHAVSVKNPVVFCTRCGRERA